MTSSGTTEVVAYLVTNKLNGKTYVGITRQSLRERRYRHLWSARKGKGYRLHAAIRKYGEDSFQWDVISSFSNWDDAVSFEMSEIARRRPEYNVTIGGDGRRSPLTAEQKAWLSSIHKGKAGTFLGKQHSDETRSLMREAKLGKPGPWRGKKRPDAAIWLSEANTGRPSHMKGIPKSAEQVEKNREAQKRRHAEGIAPKPSQEIIDNLKAHAAELARLRRKPIRCLNDGRLFECSRDAAEAYGLDKLSINSVASGRRNSVHGYRFLYEESNGRE